MHGAYLIAPPQTQSELRGSTQELPEPLCALAPPTSESFPPTREFVEPTHAFAGCRIESARRRYGLSEPPLEALPRRLEFAPPSHELASRRCVFEAALSECLGLGDEQRVRRSAEDPRCTGPGTPEGRVA